MQFTLALIAALAATGFAAPTRRDITKRDIPLSLIPDYGVTAGIPNPASNGADCLGVNGRAIPCKCPPSKEDMAAKVALFNSQGFAQITPFNFNTDVNDQSQATQKSRIDMLVIAAQNFDNTAPGVGCPAGAAMPNWVALQKSL